MWRPLRKKAFPKPVRHEEVRQEWQVRGFSFIPITDAPGQQWNDFVHSTDEVLTVVSGKLKVSIEGEEFVCNAGDEVFIPRKRVHSVHNINPDPTSWIYGYN